MQNMWNYAEIALYCRRVGFLFLFCCIFNLFLWTAASIYLIALEERTGSLGSTLKTFIWFLFFSDHFRRFCFRMFLFLVYIFYDWFNRLSRENWITLGSSLKTFNIWFLFLVIIFDASALECFFSCLHILWFIWSDWYSFQNLHFLHHTRRCICMMSSKEKCVAIKM